MSTYTWVIFFFFLLYKVHNLYMERYDVRLMNLLMACTRNACNIHVDLRLCNAFPYVILGYDVNKTIIHEVLRTAINNIMY